ncbi:putative peroxiredoxin [Andreprevotia sp. IGB-42]|uniref:peroxiredoxin-like family protein n=1 Tax=Andreprevotia sp. IGB-42 TaxID=2497473 RepID=UPI00135A2A97|nr:peroxiredoxin-like family protein [Andreprevotia sp. IGB-42]KAF0812636.1 putative peroxiredoxin [Andreprevotia sp. IGB-42]
MTTAVLDQVITTQPNLKHLFDELHAQRVKSMAPADLASNIRQRQYLKDTFDAASAAQVGDAFPDFVLEEVNGGQLTRDALLADGPLVLVFFRFATCPACNIALPYYQRTLYPALQQLGASLLAVSPQQVDRLGEIKSKHGFEFAVASDSDNQLGHQLGIVYQYDDASKAAALAKGYAIGEITGTGKWELPMPTVIVLDRAGVIRFIDVAPDWLDRTDVGPVLAAVRAAR